jgi:hypothetical protein
MNQNMSLEKSRSHLKNSNLILMAVSSTFFSRIVCSLSRLPSVLNHAHFATVPFTVAVVLATNRVKDRKQIAIAWELIYGLIVLFGVMTASALLNGAGFINVVFDFLVLGEPFLLLLAIVCIPVSQARIGQMRSWVIWSCFANMVLAIVQKPLIDAGKLSAGGLDGTDGMAGVFFVSGAGNYVSTTVSLYFAFYFFTYVKTAPLWIRLATIAGAVLQLQMSDSKQVLFAFIIAWILLVLTKVKNVGKTVIYIVAIALVVFAFLWAIENVNLPFFDAFRNYFGKEGAYGPDGAATLIKTAPFRLIPAHYHSPLNWLFGLGPGHTVGRLGGWLIKENWDILGPLGATIHPVSGEIWKAVYSNWIAMESTMFSPFFGWAGIWGDLGFLGLGVYFYLAFLVLHHLCKDDYTKFLLFSVAGFGLIFTQMEEPGFMLFTAMVVGLRWHEYRCKQQEYQYQEASEILTSNFDRDENFSFNT